MNPIRRKTLIGVSLKMYFDPARTLAWSARVAEIVRHHDAVSSGSVSLVVFPSLPVLHSVIDIFAGTGVRVGAQDLFQHDRGPYTGAISGADLAQIGCQFAEVGHAERRRQFGDDDQVVSMKVAAAVRNGLTPLLCIGEPYNGPVASAGEWCLGQLESAVSLLSPANGNIALVVAYEPVWAIGQSEAAGAEHVIAVSTAIRSWLGQRPHLAGSPVIYGGSAGPGTLPDLGDAVDGLFLGRFAHDPAALDSILDGLI